MITIRYKLFAINMINSIILVKLRTELKDLHQCNYMNFCVCIFNN